MPFTARGNNVLTAFGGGSAGLPPYFFHLISNRIEGSIIGMIAPSLKNYAGIAGTVAAIFIFFFVANFGMHMGMMKGGKMSGCPFAMGGFSMCETQANIAEHISLWETAFSAPVSKTVQLILSGLLLVAFLLLRYGGELNPGSKNSSLYLRHADTFRFFNYLTPLFSHGILHPKLYDPSLAS